MCLDDLWTIFVMFNDINTFRKPCNFALNVKIL